MRRQFLNAVLGYGMLCLLGCGGGGEEGAKVTGSVTKDGKAQPGASVSFIPADPTKGDSRGAKTNAEGKFEVHLKPGAYTVTLSRLVDKKGNVPPDSEDPAEDFTQLEATGVLRNAFPPKYADPDASPLKIDVPAGGKELPPFEVK